MQWIMVSSISNNKTFGRDGCHASATKAGISGRKMLGRLLYAYSSGWRSARFLMVFSVC
jgi:hypothetical protein